MPPKARNTTICLLATAAILAISGCSEDRSNLLPRATAERINSDLDEVRSLVRQGNCFDALFKAEEVRSEVEALGSGVDRVLRRNLIDGVTELQITVQDTCVEADTDPVEPVTPEPVTGDTTIPDEGTTGTTGGTGDSGPTGDTGGGGGQPGPEPEPDPPVDNGSGGVGPGTGGVGP